MTASEALMNAMERFSAGEPLAVVIIWTNDKNELNMESNCLSSQALGLCAYAKEDLLRGIFNK